MGLKVHTNSKTTRRFPKYRGVILKVQQLYENAQKKT